MHLPMQAVRGARGGAGHAMVGWGHLCVGQGVQGLVGGGHECAWGRGCRAWRAVAMSVHGAGGAGPGGLAGGGGQGLGPCVRGVFMYAYVCSAEFWADTSYVGPDVGRHYSPAVITHHSAILEGAWALPCLGTCFPTTPQALYFMQRTNQHPPSPTHLHLTSYQHTPPPPPPSCPSCISWLSKEEGLEVLLTPDRDGDGVGDALVGAAIIDYVVTTYTSDMR